MNSLERIRAAVAFERPDRLPVIAQVFGHAAAQVGVELDRYVQDGELLAHCQLLALERYGYDAVFALMDANVETEAMGSVLRYPRNRYPLIQENAFGDIREVSGSMLPNPLRDGRMPELLKAVAILRRELGNSYLVTGCVIGPMTLATQLLGIEDTLYSAVDVPERFGLLLDTAAEAAILFGKAQLEHGAHLPLVFEPAATPDVIPTGLFREFVVPRLHRVFSAFREAGALANWLHTAGPVTPNLPLYSDCGVDIANLDYCVDLPDAAKALPHTCVNGNIKPLSFVTDSPDTIARQSHELFAFFAKRGGFILSSGCEIPPDAKPENIAAMVQAARDLAPPRNRNGDGPVLTLKLPKGERRISFAAGQSLRDILDGTENPVRSGCSGVGACGLCRVRVEAGPSEKPTVNESVHLTRPELASGVRLACQVRPKSDMRITLVSPAAESGWRGLSDEAMSDSWHGDRRPPAAPSVNSALIAAVDVGTSHISLSVLSLATGQRLAGRYGPNPQVVWGSDVMTRLEAAAASPEKARAMREETVAAIGEGLKDVSVREGLDLRRVEQALVVANPPMHALLLGLPAAPFIKSGQAGRPCGSEAANNMDWSKVWQIDPRATIEVVPPLGGFVGSDILAGVAATNLTAGSSPALLVDFGVNSEIALWDGQKLTVSSAAGGPAFEGSGIGCAAPAETGAIYRIAFDGQDCRADVIGAKEPKALCGSGLVDLIAYLLGEGKLNAVGRFDSQIPADGFQLVLGNAAIVLTKKDVDAFQRAKAGIATGIAIVLQEAGLRAEDLMRFCVGGAFGRYLDARNAQAVGLLPSIPPERIELHGNTALLGCEKLLVSKKRDEWMQQIRGKTVVVDLAASSEFDEIFLENLYLRPHGGACL